MNDYIIITGASRGIGRAIAIKFAKAKYPVIIVSKNNYDDLLNAKKKSNHMAVHAMLINAMYLLMMNF